MKIELFQLLKELIEIITSGEENSRLFRWTQSLLMLYSNQITCNFIAMSTIILNISGGLEKSFRGKNTFFNIF